MASGATIAAAAERSGDRGRGSVLAGESSEEEREEGGEERCYITNST